MRLCAVVAVAVVALSPIARARADVDVALVRGAAVSPPDRVLVLKTERRLMLMRGDTVVRSYRVALGRNPHGHKQYSGDGRTPEGSYTLDGRNPASQYHLSMRVSYPNAYDAARANSLGAHPGGQIMIHGQPNGYAGLRRGDWTEGCIAVSNRAMEEIWASVAQGTRIEILP